MDITVNGATLRRFRMIIGMTLDDASFVLDVGKSEYSKLERSSSGVPLEYILQLRDFFLKFANQAADLFGDYAEGRMFVLIPNTIFRPTSAINRSQMNGHHAIILAAILDGRSVVQVISDDGANVPLGDLDQYGNITYDRFMPYESERVGVPQTQLETWAKGVNVKQFFSSVKPEDIIGEAGMK